MLLSTGKWLAVFVMTALGDFCWARWSAAIATNRRMSASVWSGAIVATTSMAAIAYLEEHWLLTAAIAGAMAGTYIGLSSREG